VFFSVMLENSAAAIDQVAKWLEQASNDPTSVAVALSAHAAGLSAAGGLTEAVRDHTHCIGPSETSAFAGCSTRHLIASCYSRLAHSRILYLTPPGLLVLLLPCHKRKSFQDTPFAVSAAHVRALRKYIITWLEEVCIAIHKSKVCFRGASFYPLLLF